MRSRFATDAAQMFYGPEILGSTQKIQGLYQILAGLRFLIQYGRDEYWPWFAKTMLDL